MFKVELSNVTKTIGKNTVIQNTNLVLESGRTIGLKGINGSGKTMLMRLICGLIRPTQGRITIEDKVLWKDISFPESIGVLIENPAFLDTYSGKENLKLLASIKGIIDDEKIESVIALVGLNPKEKKKYKHYSLGMKQRLGIAAAIMESPNIIVLDEPTNSLDSDGVQLVKQIVDKEKERGALVLMACHDFEVLKVLCDEIHTIKEGVITDKYIVKE